MNKLGLFAFFSFIFIFIILSAVEIAVAASISLSPSPTSVPADGESISIITVRTSDGAAGAGKTITFATNLGTFISKTCLTDCNGECIKTIKSPTAGTATVTATASGYTSGTTTITFTAITWSISLSANPTSLPAGSSTTLSARASYDVGPFDYDIKFYEGSTVIKTCGTTGKTCSYSITKPAGTHSYVAKVVAQDGTIKATSPTVSVTWTPCTPKTCAELGKECGSWDNGCGGTVNCPACTSPEICQNGQCVSSCTPNWSCTNWLPDVSSKPCGTTFTQTRTCTDSNNCGTTPPAQSQSATGTYCSSGTCSSGSCVSSVFDFSLSANPTSGAIIGGNSITTTVTAGLTSGTSQSVSFSASGLPSGAIASFSSASCNPTCTSTMTITTAPGTPASSSTITITGTGGGKTHSATYALTVNTQPGQCSRANPTVNIIPSSQSGSTGSKLQYTVTIANGDSGSGCTRQEFILTSACSSYWTCSLALPSLSIAPGSSNTTTIDVTSPSTASGSSAFSVIANSGSYLNAASATYMISAGCSGSVALALTPSTIATSGSVTPSASGLSGCDGKTVIFKMDSCTGTQVSSCYISGSGCTGDAFSGPGNTGSYSYYACIDKNGNGNFDDAGEKNSTSLNVATGACSRGNPDVIVNPSEISKGAGENHTFTITATNKDSSACDKSTFNLTTDCPQGWQCTLNPSSLSISPGSSNSSNITIKSASTAALGRYLINLTVVNGADTKYNATKNIGFIVVSKCDGASIKITDAYVYNNIAKVTVENNGTAGNLTITSANITDKSGKIYQADKLPITNFDVKEIGYINFSAAPGCANVSKVTVNTNCPKASDTSANVRCPTTLSNAIIEIVNITHKDGTVNATLRNTGSESIGSGLIKLLLNGEAVECKQTFTLAPESSKECDIPDFECSGTAKLKITEPNTYEKEFACEKIITITAQSCKDADCSQPLETFTKGEEIYFNVETNPADAKVTAVVQGETGTIDLTEPFIPDETGSYTIELTASKEGYSETTSKLSFVVEAKSSVLPKVIIVLLIIGGIAGFIFYRLRKTKKTGTYQKLYEKYGKKETYEDLYRKYGRNRRFRKFRRR